MLLRQHGSAETIQGERCVKHFLCVAVHQRIIFIMHAADKSRWELQFRHMQQTPM
jgi:hypothetical protein